MKLSLLILLVFATGALAFVYWHFSNAYKAKHGRKKRLRRSDRVQLNRQQKAVYKEAIRQFRNGNLKSSARMLASLDMHREAINILERGRHIHEAAQMLMQIKRPNRAGYMYARHSMYKEAVDCFIKAKMPSEVAKYAKLSGDLSTALVYYQHNNDFQEAAECYSELGKHKEAAQLFTKVGNSESALKEYFLLLDKEIETSGLDFSNDELETLRTYLLKDDADTRLADILASKNELVPLIISLIKGGKIDKACDIYVKSPHDIGPALIRYSDFNSEQAYQLAQLLQKASAYEYAGKVFERGNHFKEAADAFRLEEDYERAAYCYQRAGMREKHTEMKIELAAKGPSSKQPAHPATEDTPPPPQETPSPSPIAINVEPEIDKTPKFRIEATSSGDQGSNTPPPPVNLNPAKPVVPSFMVDEEDTNPGFDKRESTKFEPIDPHADYPDINWSGFHDAKFLQDLTTDQRETIRKVGRIKAFQPEEVILDYQEEPIGIYFILAGKVRVHRHISGVDTPIDTMAPPETIGKLWLFMDRPTQVKFVANEDSTLLGISRGDFMDILDKDGTVARNIYKRITTSLIQKIVTMQDDKGNLEAS